MRDVILKEHLLLRALLTEKRGRIAILKNMVHGLRRLLDLREEQRFANERELRQEIKEHDEAKRQVRVGVAVFLYNYNAPGQFLVGLRKGSHGAGTWELPGGHLEFGETVRDAVVREVAEETGMLVDVPSILPAGWSESQFPEYGRHYVTAFVAAKVANNSPEPRIIEPEKCAEWRWVMGKETLAPDALFPPLASYLFKNDAPRPAFGW